MGRRSKPRHGGPADLPPSDWSTERTLADVEADTQPADAEADAGSRCACGGREFLLQAYLHVVDGLARPVPVEVEGLTCPACGREYDVVELGDGRYERGDFVGMVELDEDE